MFAGLRCLKETKGYARQLGSKKNGRTEVSQFAFALVCNQTGKRLASEIRSVIPESRLVQGDERL